MVQAIFFKDFYKIVGFCWGVFESHRKKKLQEKNRKTLGFYSKLPGKSVGFPGFFPGVFSYDFGEIENG